MELVHNKGSIVRALGLLALLLAFGTPRAPVYAQAVPGCEFPPVDEPDGDGDECYVPPDPTQSMGDPNNPDTNAPNQPGQQGGEPINYPSGNMFMFQRDYASATVFPLSFDRVYNSQSTSIGSLGANWTHNYAAAIKLPSSTTAQVIRGDGKTITFTLTGGAWVAGPAINSRLTQLTDSSGNTTGWVYKTGDDKTETYNAGGLLQSIANRAGVKQTLTYSGALLTQVADPFGRKLSFAYDGNGRIVGLTDPSARDYEYTYDANGNQTSITYPDGTSRRYLYENSAVPNQMTGLIDEKGVRYVTWTYDSGGHALSSSLPGGVAGVTVQYDFVNGSTFVMDARNNTTRYDYFTFGGAERTLHVNQPSVHGGLAQNSWIFDVNGNISSYVDFLGNTANYAFDLTRNLELTRSLPDGQVVNTTWNPSFRLPTQIQSENSLDQRTYDGAGNLTQRVLSDTGSGARRTWGFTYNAYGEALTATDGNGNVTKLAYDSQGNLASVTDALGHKTTFRHDADGRVIRSVDPNGLTSSYLYDARGRLTTKNVGLQTFRYSYDLAGNLTAVAQPSGYNLTMGYDAAHRLTSVTDSFGNRIAYMLDLVGNRIGEQHFDASKTQIYTHSWTYDTLNRVASDVGAIGQTTTYAYDDDSNRLNITDPLGNSTAFAYDPVNRLVQATAPDSGITGYSYDLLNHLVGVTDPRSLVTSYSVDALSDTGALTSPDTGAAAQVFDGNGNVVSRTDAKGQKLLYQYDDLNRLTKIIRGDTNQSIYLFTYDQTDWLHHHGIGHLTSMSDAVSRTDYSYDLQGHVVAKAQKVVNTVLTTRYRFDPVSGNVRVMVMPSLAAVRYSFLNGRVSAMRLTFCRPDHDWDDDEDNGGDDNEFRDCDARQLVTGIQWEPFGGPNKWTFGNGERDGRTYDLDGRIVAEDIDGAITYDAASRISGVTLGGSPGILASGTRSYNYDSVGRQTSVTSGDKSISLAYQYDLDGNRLQLTAGAQQINYVLDGASNHLLSSSQGSIAYSYDANGSTLTEGGYTYSYDRQSRLSGVASPIGSAQYFFNGLGQRTEKTGSAGTIIFSYDMAGQLVGEYDGQGHAVEETIYLGSVPVAVAKPVGTFYVHSDYRNTPRQIDDARALPVWTWNPTSFGGDVPNENPLSSGNVRFVYNLRFPGQYYDAETGLFYNYHRDYNPRIGRYIESDPIGLNGGLNTYVYADGNPVSLTDPSGEIIPLIIFGALGGGIVGDVVYIGNQYFTGQPITAGGLGGAFVGGAISGGIGVIAAPIAGVLGLGSGVFGTAVVNAVGGALGTAVANSLDPCGKVNADTILAGALGGALGGYIAGKLFPVVGMSTFGQVGFPRTWTGVIPSIFGGNAGSNAISAIYTGGTVSAFVGALPPALTADAEDAGLLPDSQ